MEFFMQDQDRSYDGDNNTPNSYREGTEVLTENGFMDFRDVKDDTIVAQCEDGNISFINHLGISSNPFDGELYDLSGEGYQQKVTPNHNCVYVGNDDNYKLVKADYITQYRKKLPVSAVDPYNTNTLVDPRAFLNIAYIEAGSIYNKLNGKNKKGKITYRWIPMKTGVKNAISVEDAAKALGYDTLQTPYGELFVWIPETEELSNTYSFIDLKELSYGKASKIISLIKEWNSVRYSNVCDYVSVEHRHINYIMSVAIMSGLHPIYEYGVNRINSETYGINFNDSATIDGDDVVKSKVKYNGMVYNIKVPSGVIITRINSNIAISGSV